MKKDKYFKIFRTIIQVLALLIFPELISLVFLGMKLFFINIFNMDISNLLQDSSLFIIVSISTFIFGRFFCGYLCIFGALNDWLYLTFHKIFRIKFKVPKKADLLLKKVKYLFLIFLILFVWSNIITISNYIYPWDAYVQIFNISNILNIYYIAFIILLVTIIGSIFIERFFCRYFCPMGAWFSFISRFRVLKMKKDTSLCGKCSACSLKCSMGIDLNKETINSGECIQCFNCTKLCHKNNIQAKISNKSINEYAAISIILGSTIGINSYVDYKINNNNLNSVVISETVGKYIDGTYSGIGYGYRPNLKVSVTIKNGLITNIIVTSSSETASYLSRAQNTIISEIISSQSTDVDVVSGATRTSNGIMEAVSNALQNVTNSSTEDNSSSTGGETENSDSSIANNSIYNDGTYSGIGYGYRPNLKVSVTIKNGEISSISIVSSNETPKYLNRVKNTIINEIISSQSTDVDAVSGATRSSNGIMQAVSTALKSALK